MDDAQVCRAIEDIKNLKSRYFQYMDLKNWLRYPELLAQDMVVYNEDGSVRSTGGAAFARAVSSFLADANTIHQAYMPEIEIIDPDNARGVWAMHDVLTWENGDPFTGIKRMEGWGHYHESYRREPDGWKVASLKLTRLRVDVSK